MLKWLDRLTTPRSALSREAAARLRDYPVYRAPHVGPPSGWTLVQAEENLAYLLQHRAHRLVVLGDWLKPEGIDIRPALCGGQPLPLVDHLHQWANACWPGWHDPAIATPEVWLRSRRAGREVVYSLLFDIALLLSELVLQRHPGYQWALDLDDENARDGMHSHRRAVLVLPPHGRTSTPTELDFEALVVARYCQPADVIGHLTNPWSEAVASALEGAHDSAWMDALSHR